MQYVNEQPKITDSTILRRMKLKKKALHMTGDEHRAFSAAKCVSKTASNYLYEIRARRSDHRQSVVARALI